MSDIKKKFTAKTCLLSAILFLVISGRSTDYGPPENAYFFIRFRLPSTLIRSKTEVYVCENGGFRKRFLEWRFSKTEVQPLCVDGRKRRFSKTKTDVFLSVFGGQVWTVENAAKTLVWTKNFVSVFKKQKTEVFENALVWTGPISPR